MSSNTYGRNSISKKEAVKKIMVGYHMNDNIKKMLENLSKSKFRNSFHLKENDKTYIIEKGIDKIEEHANEFISKRLAPRIIPNDGHQTPMRGHPIFVAQHATATCCRECLYKWHKIKKDKELTKEEINYINKILITWIKNEVNF